MSEQQRGSLRTDQEETRLRNLNLGRARMRYRAAVRELDEVKPRFEKRTAVVSARLERLMKPLRPSRYQRIRMVLAQREVPAMLRIRDSHRGHVYRTLPDVRRAEARLEELRAAEAQARLNARVRVAEAAAQLLRLLPKDGEATTFAELESHIRWLHRLNRKAQAERR